MRNYKPQPVITDYIREMRNLGINIIFADDTYPSIRGVLLMLAEENMHHRKALDKLQIELDQLLGGLVVVATGEMPDEKA